MSKVIRPVLTEIFPRKRLFWLLDQMRKQPAIWVSGPAGCGKTTLISSYIESRKSPCLWYQVDGGDADPATFFYYMRQAAKKAAPRKRTPLPLLTREYLQDIPTFTLRYFENLFSRLKVPGIVIFDNYQEVPIDSPLHDIILNGLARIPEEINVILISRSEPPPVLIRLRANHLMEVLGWDELRLTMEESQGIIQLRAKQQLSKETISDLHRATEGWAAGLVLILESMKRGMKPQMLGKLTPEEIVDYFGSELLNKTDKEMQEFFLKTAFLPKMTAKMAEELTNLPTANRILSTLSRNNYFIERRIQKEPVYQYHPLYRDFLLLHARETYSQDALLTLLRRAAVLLEEDDQTEAAIELFRDLGDWDAMVQIIMRQAPSMLEQGRYQPLKDWLGGLPKEILDGNPWLLFWMGQSRFPFDFSISRSFFEKAFEGFKNQKDTTGMFRSWSALVYAIWQEGRDFSLFDHWVQALEELYREVKEFPSAEIGAWVASMMVAILAARQPWHSDVDAWAERALSLAEACPNTQVKTITLFMVSFYRINTGQMRKASHLINSLRQLLRSGDVPPLPLLTVKYMESYFYRFIGMHEEALRDVSEGLEISRKTGVHGFDQWFWGQGAASALDVQDFKTAGDFFAKADSSFAQFPTWNQCHYHMYRIKEALFLKDAKLASFHADMALKVAADIGTPLSHNVALIYRAYVMHELRKDKEAVNHLSQAYDIGTRSKNKLQIFYILLARSRFAFDEGNEASGISFLKEAFAIGSEEGIIGTLTEYPSNLSMLCARALEAGIEMEYAQKMIRMRKLTPEKPHLYLENWPWPVKIFTLGRFELLKDGKPIQFARKAQQKPLSLLKALIALGGREVKEEDLADFLWPEADGDAAHHSFEMTLHRLRSLIGNPEALQFKDGRLKLDQKYCWVDIWAFDHILAEADKKMEEGFPDRAVHLTQKAIEMYRGAFIAGETEQPGVISLSERLRSKFLRSVSWLGHYWEQAEKYEKALDCYHRGLEVDDLAEALYRRLMTCHQRLGQKAEALSVYNRCKKTLSANLNIEPSLETQAVYKALNSNVRQQ